MTELYRYENICKMRGERKRNIPLEKYAKEKLNMLLNEFYLILTDADIRHFYELQSEAEIDAYTRYLIVSKL